MSRSPRKNLRMALDELDDLVAVIERHPQAREELVAEIGEELLGEILTARETIARAVSRLNAKAVDSHDPSQRRPDETAGRQNGPV